MNQTPAPRAAARALCLGAISASLTLAVASCAHPSGTPEAQRSASIQLAPAPSAFVERGYRTPHYCAVAEQMPPQRAAAAASIPPAVAYAKPTAQPGSTPPTTGRLSEADARARAEAIERTRLALEAANPPILRRGDVSQAAAAGAELCVNRIRIEFSLLTNGGHTAPTIADIRRLLEGAGLTGVTIDAGRGAPSSGPSFAASTGEACLLGRFAAETPTFTIAPLPADKVCRPD